MKRLCIYLTYDKQKIIDRYVGYMLKELRSCMRHLVVVCNMPEVVRGEEILKAYADEIFYRENIGFDAGGFKEALCSLIGWETVLTYDELVLVNDSFFGPFRSMDSIFRDMDKRDCDFWGLAKHGACEGKGTHDFPEYIQSYCLVIRSRMLHSGDLKKYWEDMPFYREFWDVVVQHEEKFTTYFSGLGYSYDVLADIEVNDSKSNLMNNYSQYVMISYELIRKRNFPFLKKQQIAYNTLDFQTQENLYQALQYIDKETAYDVDLIWENIIRTLNMTDLQRSLHLQYIIPSGKRELAENKSISIVIYATYKEAVEYILEYLGRLSWNRKYYILVVSENEDVLNAYREQGIHGKKPDRDMIDELAELSGCDFVCVLHDADVLSDREPSYIGKSYLYCIWENLLRDEDHVSGILEKFEAEGRLGFLAPPQPNFADFFGNLGDGWGGNYRAVEEIIERLQLKCQVSMDLPPFRAAADFWARGSILKYLERLRVEDYRYIPYLWIYFAQDRGYYSGIVESMDYAAMDKANILYYIKEIASQVKREYGDFQDFHGLREKILLNALEMFCYRYPRILLYGTGFYAQKYRNALFNVEACVVSDGQKKADFFEGLPVLYLSEVKELEQCGIVLCLSKKNQEQVLPIIKKAGAQKYFCISE